MEPKILCGASSLFPSQLALGNHAIYPCLSYQQTRHIATQDKPARNLTASSVAITSNAMAETAKDCSIAQAASASFRTFPVLTRYANRPLVLCEMLTKDGRYSWNLGFPEEKFGKRQRPLAYQPA
jgi:hypothetical protein